MVWKHTHQNWSQNRTMELLDIMTWPLCPDHTVCLQTPKPLLRPSRLPPVPSHMSPSGTAILCRGILLLSAQHLLLLIGPVLPRGHSLPTLSSCPFQGRITLLFLIEYMTQTWPIRALRPHSTVIGSWIGMWIKLTNESLS